VPDGRGSFTAGTRIVLLSTASRLAVRPTHTRAQWDPGTLSPEVRRPGSEVDSSPPPSAEVRNGAAIPPLAHAFSWLGA
jgi:hypothetical protein